MLVKLVRGWLELKWLARLLAAYIVWTGSIALILWMFAVLLTGHLHLGHVDDDAWWNTAKG
jgi:hypothetical protein